MKTQIPPGFLERNDWPRWPPEASSRTVAERPRPRRWPLRNDARQASGENRRSVAWGGSWWSGPQRPSLGDGHAVWRVEAASRDASISRPTRREFDMTNQGAKGTALLTPKGLLIRDSESFGPRFRGAEGTLGVPIGPWSRSLEMESARELTGSSQLLAANGPKRQTPGGRSLGVGR
jgi:hypothetical protein